MSKYGKQGIRKGALFYINHTKTLQTGSGWYNRINEIKNLQFEMGVGFFTGIHSIIGMVASLDAAQGDCSSDFSSPPRSDRNTGRS